MTARGKTKGPLKTEKNVEKRQCPILQTISWTNLCFPW